MSLSFNNFLSASINSNQLDTKIPTEKKPEYKDNTHLLNGMISSLKEKQFGFAKDFEEAQKNKDQPSWQRASLKSTAYQAAIDDLSELEGLAGKTHKDRKEHNIILLHAPENIKAAYRSVMESLKDGSLSLSQENSSDIKELLLSCHLLGKISGVQVTKFIRSAIENKANELFTKIQGPTIAKENQQIKSSGHINNEMHSNTAIHPSLRMTLNNNANKPSSIKTQAPTIAQEDQRKSSTDFLKLEKEVELGQSQKENTLNAAIDYFNKRRKEVTLETNDLTLEAISLIHSASKEHKEQKKEIENSTDGNSETRKLDLINLNQKWLIKRYEIEMNGKRSSS